MYVRGHSHARRNLSSPVTNAFRAIIACFARITRAALFRERFRARDAKIKVREFRVNLYPSYTRGATHNIST